MVGYKSSYILAEVFYKVETDHHFNSAAASGWALAHPEFGSSVNPITTRGTHYAHHISTSPPGFEIPAASLIHYVKKFVKESQFLTL